MQEAARSFSTQLDRRGTSSQHQKLHHQQQQQLQQKLHHQHQQQLQQKLNQQKLKSLDLTGNPPSFCTQGHQ